MNKSKYNKDLKGFTNTDRKLLNKLIKETNYYILPNFSIMKKINPLANIDNSKFAGRPFGIIESIDPENYKK